MSDTTSPPAPASGLAARLRSVPWGGGGLALSAAILAVHAWSYDFISDDAFITARYARNLVRGEGLVYNIGDRVEGYSSLTWTLLTAALGRAGVDYVVAMRGLSMAAALGCLVALFLAAPRMGISRNRPSAAFAPLLLSASGSFACWALGGLETCGYALTILSALLLARIEDGPDGEPRDGSPLRLAAAGVAAGICALTRPEGVLVPIAITGFVLFARGRQGIVGTTALLLPALALVAAQIAWRRHFYGEWLANTAYAKVGIGMAVAVRGGEYVVAGAQDNGGLVAWAAPFVLVWWLYREPFIRLTAAVGLSLLAFVVAVGGDALAMYRFLAPIFPLWLLLVAKMLGDLAALDRWPARPSPLLGSYSKIPGGRVLASAIAISLAASIADPHQLLLQREYYVWHKTEIPNWKMAGEWLAKHSKPGDSVACVPIGAVGYYSDLKVYDMLGLTDKHIAHLKIALGSGVAGHEKHDGPYILAKRPTYLLLGNIDVSIIAERKNSPFFCRPAYFPIRDRENDIFTPELRQLYEPQVELLSDGANYLSFFKLKE